MDDARLNAEPIGREALVAEVARLLATDRAVILTGPGGVGKTTIARAVASHGPGSGPCTWVDLTGVTSTIDMAARVAATLGIGEPLDAPLDVAIDAALAARTALLVLDNLEEVPEAGPWIAARLDGSTAIRVLGTSRRRIRFTGEVPVPVPGLALPAHPDPEAVARSAAGQLFLRRARAIGSRVPVDPANAQALHDLLVRLDGLPLAIELAAGRSRVLSPAQMLDRLGSATLLGRPSGGDPRHRSLAAVLDWSLDLLTPGERALLDSLSPWIGPFDVELVEAVSTAPDPLADLDGLIEAGLAQAVAGSHGEPAFRVLETVRSRAGMEAGPTASVRLASTLAARLDAWEDSITGRSASGRRWFAVARPTVEHLAHQLDDAAGGPATDDAPGHALAVAAAPYWHIAGVHHEPLRLARQATRAADAGTRTRALIAVSMLEAAQDAGTAGRVSAASALDAALAMRSVELETAALYRLGIVHLNAGEADAGRSALRNALRLANSAGRQGDAIAIRHRLADIDQPAADTVAALTPLLEEARDAGDPDVVASVLNDLAANEAFVGRFEESLAHAGAARAACLAAGQPIRAAWAGLIAASSAARLGRLETARSLLIDSAETSLASGRSLQGFVLSKAVSVLLALELASIAARVVGASDAQYRRSGQVNAPDEEAAWQQDVEATRRLAGAVLWHVEYRSGYEAPMETVVGDIVAALRAGPAPRAHPRGTMGLTHREVEILTLVGRGLSDNDIAEQLSISPKTASVHLSNIKAKLDVETRIEAAIRARDLGLVARVN